MRMIRDRRARRDDRRRRRAHDGTGVIDLTGDDPATAGGTDADTGWPDEVRADPAIAERMAEARRRREERREERREAEAELLRLRARHWSGERLIEEGRRELEWWEHPDADPYAVLGIVPGATLEDASQARRSIASQNHPDLVPDGNPEVALERTRRMVAANAAYDRLKRALLPHQLDDGTTSRAAAAPGPRPSPRRTAER